MTKIHITNQSNYNGWTVRVNGEVQSWSEGSLEDDLANHQFGIDSPQIKELVQQHYGQDIDLELEEDTFST